MKYRGLAFLGLCLFAALAAACSGGGSSSTPAASTSSSLTTQTYAVTTTGSFTLAAPMIGGNLASIIFPAAASGPGSASITLTTSGQLPGGLQPLAKGRLPQALRSVADFNYAAQYYYTLAPSAALGFSSGPTWNVTIGSPVSNAAYFIAYYDPTIPGWNVGYEGGAPQSTPSPNATNVAYSFTPAPNASPFTLAMGGSNFALVAITGATPTPAPTFAVNTANNIIQDPGFETEGAAGTISTTSSPWYVCTNPTNNAKETPNPSYSGDPTATIQNTVAHSGSYAALAGSTNGEPNGAVGVCQNVTVPASPTVLSFWVLPGGNDASKYIHQEAYLISGGTSVQLNLPNNNYTCTGAVNVPSGEPTPAPSPKDTGPNYDCTGTPSTPTWQQITIPASQFSQLAGQSATLYFGVFGGAYANGYKYGYAVYMFVDDVVLY
jgi:hypothetical protein